MDNTTPPPPGGGSDQPSDSITFRPEGSGSDQPMGETPQAEQPTQPVYSPPPSFSPPPVPSAAPQDYSPPPAQQGYQPPTQNYGPPQPQPQQQQYPQQPQYQQQPVYPAQYPAQQVNVTPKKSGMPGWAIALIITVVAIVLLCGGAYVVAIMVLNKAGSEANKFIDTAGATVTASSFDSYMQANSYDQAYDQLGGSLASQYNVAELKRRWEALGNGGSITTKTSDFTFDNNRSQVTWSLTPSDGSTKNVKLTIEKSGSTWKITGADPTLIPSP